LAVSARRTRKYSQHPLHGGPGGPPIRAGFAAFYETLKAKGKPHKVIRVAMARKLLVRLSAKARDARRAMAQLA
jgi:hypothetical protein